MQRRAPERDISIIAEAQATFILLYITDNRSTSKEKDNFKGIISQDILHWRRVPSFHHLQFFSAPQQVGVAVPRRALFLHKSQETDAAKHRSTIRYSYTDQHSFYRAVVSRGPYTNALELTKWNHLLLWLWCLFSAMFYYSLLCLFFLTHFLYDITWISHFILIRFVIYISVAIL